MNVWDYALSRSWILPGLPGGEPVSARLYSFYVGGLDYVERSRAYLHIPEMHARDAEGRPRYPEQERWTALILAKCQIRAREIWYSHWQLATRDDAVALIKVLWSLGALRIWRWGYSDQPDGGVEYSFEIVPSCAGPFGLRISAAPGGVVAMPSQIALLDKIGSKLQVRGSEFSFETIDAVVHFEHTLQQLGAVYLGEV